MATPSCQKSNLKKKKYYKELFYLYVPEVMVQMWYTDIVEAKFVGRDRPTNLRK